MRDSEPVKFRFAFGAGRACPASPSFTARPRARASSAAFAAWIFASRPSARCSSSGSPSPCRSRPCSTSPAAAYGISTCTNSPFSATPCVLRKSLRVRKSGVFPAARRRYATSSSSFIAIRRDEYVPVLYPHSNRYTSTAATPANEGGRCCRMVARGSAVHRLDAPPTHGARARCCDFAGGRRAVCRRLAPRGRHGVRNVHRGGGAA